MNLNDALKYSTDGRTHADFVDAALANPKQEVHPLAYADWLQEQGQEGLAEHIRRSIQQQKAMGFHDTVLKRSSYGKARTKPFVEVYSVPDDNTFTVESLHPSGNPKQLAAFATYQHTGPELEKVLDAFGDEEGVAEARKWLSDWKEARPELFTEE